MDVNKDGTLDRKEMKKLLIMSGEEVTRELIESIFDIVDEDKSGTIGICEFVTKLNFNQKRLNKVHEFIHREKRDIC